MVEKNGKVEIGEDGKVELYMDAGVAEFASSLSAILGRIADGLDYLSGRVGDLVTAEERTATVLEAAFKADEENGKK